MTIEKYIKTALPLTVAGILFAGYMTGIKLFSGTCAFSEPCPTLWGYPACFYGFFIFSAMFVVTLMALLKKKNSLGPVRANLILSGFGILFSGYFAVPELTAVIRDGQNYQLGLPTCAYGLVFYVVIFIVTAAAFAKNRKG